MSTEALAWAVVALAAVDAVLMVAVAWLLRDRARTRSRQQSDQDLLAENTVHALAELVLRVDALDAYVRETLSREDGQGR